MFVEKKVFPGRLELKNSIMMAGKLRPTLWAEDWKWSAPFWIGYANAQPIYVIHESAAVGWIYLRRKTEITGGKNESGLRSQRA